MQFYIIILEFFARLGALGAPALVFLTLPLSVPVMVLIVYLRNFGPKAFRSRKPAY